MIEGLLINFITFFSDLVKICKKIWNRAVQEEDTLYHSTKVYALGAEMC